MRGGCHHCPETEKDHVQHNHFDLKKKKKTVSKTGNMENGTTDQATAKKKKSKSADGEERGRSRDRRHKKNKKKKGKRGLSSGKSSQSRSPSRDRGGGSEAGGGRGREKSRSASREGRSQSRGRSKDRKGGRSRSRSSSKGRKSTKSDEPKDWSREELVEKLKKLGSFQMDKSTGSGVFECVGKRILPEDIVLVLEMLRRFNEIQKITFKKCLLTDEIFAEICEGLKFLRHLRHLDLSTNLLTRTTLQLIISTFALNSRRLEHLDLRSNNLNDEDGRTLYRVFNNIITLNGISIAPTRGKLDTPSLDLTDQGLRICEVGILCSLLPDCKQMCDVSLAHNSIDCRGLTYLVACLRVLPQLSKLDLSFNPLTFPDDNMSGMEQLVLVCRQRKQLHYLKLEGIKVPELMLTKIEHSLMVNRSIHAAQYSGAFDKFAARKLAEKAPPERVNVLADWNAGFTIDYVFSKLNRIPERTVEVIGDDIIITKLAMRKATIQEY